jgi:hypothetical protein
MGPGMKLFMAQVGGSVASANTELHDIRFTIGETIEDCYDDLRSQWWGDPGTLHLDAWGVVDHTDGFDVAVTTEPQPGAALRLFFVNLGGYDPAKFGQLHRNLLIVEKNARAVKSKTLRSVRNKDDVRGRDYDQCQRFDRAGWLLPRIDPD